MNIELLAEMIGKLILKQDEVALPGLGVFVAEEVEAVFSDKGFTVNPPYRRLVFRQKESTDNSLAELYATEKSVSPDVAAAKINGFMKLLGAALKERKSIYLPGLGRLRATRQNHFFFVQDEYSAIFPEGFGLESISLKSLATNRTVPALKFVADPEVEADAKPEVETVPPQAPKPEPKPKPAPTPVPVRKYEYDLEYEPRKKRPLLTVLLVLLILAVVFFAAVAVIGRVAPEIIDPLLYSPEQLELLGY